MMYQMVAGIYDIMSHILEQYLSDSDDNTSDYIAEGLMRSLIVSSRKALQNPQDYEARSNIMWTATWALNGYRFLINHSDDAKRKFERLAKNVWDVEGALNGLETMESWMRELGMAMNIADCSAKESRPRKLC